MLGFKIMATGIVLFISALLMGIRVEPRENMPEWLESLGGALLLVAISTVVLGALVAIWFTKV